MDEQAIFEQNQFNNCPQMPGDFVFPGFLIIQSTSYPNLGGTNNSICGISWVL